MQAPLASVSSADLSLWSGAAGVVTFRAGIAGIATSNSGATSGVGLPQRASHTLPLRVSSQDLVVVEVQHQPVPERFAQRHGPRIQQSSPPHEKLRSVLAVATNVAHPIGNISFR